MPIIDSVFVATKTEQFLIDTIPPSAIAVVNRNIPVMTKVIPQVFSFVGHTLGPEVIEQDGSFFYVGCVRPNCGITWAITFYETVSSYDNSIKINSVGYSPG